MKRRTPPLRRFVVAAIRQIERPGAFWLASGLIILIATALRTLTLPDRPLWLDETYSAWFASRSLVELWTEVPLYETHPPLYYTLLKGWISLFGSSEA